MIPQPVNILRGHKAQVHAATFIRNNTRLVTGDAEGFVVIWDLTIMRARGVWKAHENAILAVEGWGGDKLITHGRDHKCVVWKLDEQEEERLSAATPLDQTASSRHQPWILHMLNVNTMNFCSFSACPNSADCGSIDDTGEIMVAFPNALASEAVDIFQLPSQSRVHTVRPAQKNGMAMCLSLFHKDAQLTLVAAFENGFASVYRLNAAADEWTVTYRTQAHSQPILSLCVDANREYFLSSAADAIIAKHPIPVARQESTENMGARLVRKSKAWEDALKVVNTKHSGQQGLTMRSDARIFATAGWDSNVRVYSTKTLKELAVLQWHNVGVYAVAFASLREEQPPSEATPEDKVSCDTSSATSQAIATSDSQQVRRTTVKQRRLERATTAHWIAAGAKDGKVSLWDIY